MSASLAKSVLIVDDNEMVRTALGELFTRESEFMVCSEAGNGREAIEKAQQRSGLLFLREHR